MLKSMVTAGLLAGLNWLDMLSAVLLLRGSGASWTVSHLPRIARSPLARGANPCTASLRACRD